MRVFISQRMIGKSIEQIECERKDIIADFKAMFPNDNVEVIDSFRPEFRELPPKKAIIKSLELLADADLLYAPSDVWGGGCQIEMCFADTYHIPVLRYDITLYETFEGVKVCDR